MLADVGEPLVGQPNLTDLEASDVDELERMIEAGKAPPQLP
jgi:hypothetical protein